MQMEVTSGRKYIQAKFLKGVSRAERVAAVALKLVEADLNVVIDLLKTRAASDCSSAISLRCFDITHVLAGGSRCLGLGDATRKVSHRGGLM